MLWPHTSSETVVSTHDAWTQRLRQGRSAAPTAGSSCATPPSGATTFAYDSRGNRTTVTPPGGPSTALAYDQANRLTAYGANATYAYDGDGLRASKTVSSTPSSFSWDVAESLPLLLVDGTTNYVYGPGGLPLEQVSDSGSVLYFHHDQLGSTRALTDSTGASVATYTYDAYGNLTGSTGSVTNPFGYAGEYTDAESGLIYLRARYYDPATAQFLNRDPLEPITGTPYGYAANDPLNLRDPSGLDPDSYTYYTAAPKPQEMSDSDYCAYLDMIASFNELTRAEEQGARRWAAIQQREREERQPPGWSTWTIQQKKQYIFEHDTKYIPLQDTSFQIVVEARPIQYALDAVACVQGAITGSTEGPVGAAVGCIASAAGAEVYSRGPMPPPVAV